MRSQGAAVVVFSVLFVLLTCGIVFAFAGEGWGRYLAFGAFGLIVLWAMSREETEWRTTARRRIHHWREHFRRPRTSRRAAPAALAHRTNRERMEIEERTPDPLEQGGSLLLFVLVVILVLGAGWVFLKVSRG